MLPNTLRNIFLLEALRNIKPSEGFPVSYLHINPYYEINKFRIPPVGINFNEHFQIWSIYSIDFYLDNLNVFIADYMKEFQ